MRSYYFLKVREDQFSVDLKSWSQQTGFLEIEEVNIQQQELFNIPKFKPRLEEEATKSGIRCLNFKFGVEHTNTIYVYEYLLDKAKYNIEPKSTYFEEKSVCMYFIDELITNHRVVVIRGNKRDVVKAVEYLRKAKSKLALEFRAINLKNINEDALERATGMKISNIKKIEGLEDLEDMDSISISGIGMLERDTVKKLHANSDVTAITLSYMYGYESTPTPLRIKLTNYSSVLIGSYNFISGSIDIERELCVGLYNDILKDMWSDYKVVVPNNELLINPSDELD